MQITLNNQQFAFSPNETIWDIAKRNGIDIPHLCHKEGYRPDGNCRACVVEIEGERVLSPSCCRVASEGMVVQSQSSRALKSQHMVQQLLVKPEKTPCQLDLTNPAIAVNHDACIACGLCVRACRETQHNDVIGMSFRGNEVKITFDLDASMGGSTCVSCGECVEACPTKALIPQNQKLAQKTVNSLCPFCGVGCQTTVSVKNNTIVEVNGKNGKANEGRLCVKGRYGYDYVHHKDRLTTPLIRIAGKEKSLKDPLSQFRKATWEEALSLVANKFSTIKTKYGGTAMAAFGSAKGSNEEAYLLQKFVRVAFQSNNIDHCTRLCHASSVAALLEGLNSAAVSAPFTAAKDANCIIVIGARPSENHPVAATFMKDAAQKGAKLYVLDPRGQNQGLSRYAYKHLQFKPSKDVALLNAMLFVIITEGLENQTYIEQYVEGYTPFKANILAQNFEELCEIAGIAKEEIQDIARTYAKSKASLIFWGMGVSQHIHGTDNARCLIALALITGQIGRKGSGLHPLRGQNNVQGASDAGLIPFAYPDYRPVDDDKNHAFFEQYWNAELSQVKGLTVVEILNAAETGAIKALYVAGENPAMSDPDQNHARHALKSLDFMVCQDIFLTETASLADVILPATAHAEKQGTYTNTNRQVQMGRQVIVNESEAKHDWQIVQDIAQKMKINWNYNSVSEIYEEMRGAMPTLKHISFARIEREESVTYPVECETQSGEDIIFTHGFPTPTGKAKLVPVNVSAPFEEIDSVFPFILTTGRLLEHWHTGAMTRRASLLDAIEPEATVGINPSQMRELALKSNEKIKVKTRRGEVILKIRADKDVPKNMLFIPFAFHEAAANILTTSALDPIGKIPEFKHAAAAIERIATVECAH